MKTISTKFNYRSSPHSNVKKTAVNGDLLFEHVKKTKKGIVLWELNSVRFLKLVNI